MVIKIEIFVKYLTIHELIENHWMTKHNMLYKQAHKEKATPAEKHAVEADGISWKEYSKALDPYIKKDQGEDKKGIESKLPKDLYKKPYEDEKDRYVK